MKTPQFGIHPQLFLTGIALALIVLKLTGHIELPWWLVLAPIWIPVAFWLVVLLLGMLLIQASKLFGRKDNKP